MIRNLHIKICGLTLAGNRKELEDLPVDFFGAVFYPGSPRYVGKKNEDELKELFSSGKFTTGVFVDAPIEKVIEIQRRNSLTHIQLHGNESPEYCRMLRSEGVEVIKSFNVHHNFDFSVCEAFIGMAGIFLFDTKGKSPGGTGRKFHWPILENYKLPVPFFLSGGIAPGDEEVIGQFNHPFWHGIDLNSGFEDYPGIKNHKKIESFLHKIE